jgi:hypothetical protein
VSFAAITLCVASQRVFIVVYFVIDSVRKILDTPLELSLEIAAPTEGFPHSHQIFNIHTDLRIARAIQNSVRI